MQQEISENILLPQHSLIFNNSNIVFRYIKGTQHYQLHLHPQPPPGIHLPLQPGQHIPLLIECSSDSDWAGNINTRQSTSGSLVTILKNNMHSNSKTQQVIATSSAEAELYAISSTIADAIHLKQLMTEIENNIGISTFDFDKHQPNIVCSAILLLPQAWRNEWGSTNEPCKFNFAFCEIQILRQAGRWAACS